MARRRIPNWLNAALVVTGLGAQALFHGGGAALGGLAAALVTLVVLWSPWSKGRLGGGDVKAMLGAASWLGLGLLLHFFLLAALVGGLAALVCLFASSASVRREVRNNLALVALRVGLPAAPIRGGAGRVSVPLGAAAALAALALLWWS